MPENILSHPITEAFGTRELFCITHVITIESNTDEVQKKEILRILNKFTEWRLVDTLSFLRKPFHRALWKNLNKTTIFNIESKRQKNGSIKVSIYNDASKTEHTRKEIQDFLNSLTT